MNLFANPTYNGQFLAPNSAKPLAGVCTNNAYKRNLIEARVAEGSIVFPGAPSIVSNKVNNETEAVNAGLNLKPTTLSVVGNWGEVDTVANAIAVMSPNAVLEEGSTAPIYFANQIVYVALFGSGVELYIPCDNTVIEAADPVYYNWNTQTLVSAAAKPLRGVLFTGLILSSVVDGAKISVNKDTGVATIVDTPVIKVRL